MLKKMLSLALVIGSCYVLYRTTHSHCTKNMGDYSVIRDVASYKSLIHCNGVPSPAVQKLFQQHNIPCPETLEALEAFVQKHFTRQPHTERWQLSREKLVSALLVIFTQLGQVDEIKAPRQQYTYVFILGALASTMKKRINYVEQLLKEGYTFDHIVLLTGERPANPDKESEWIGKTEADIFDALCKKSSLPQNKIHLVSCKPKPDGSRPTTDDTVIHFRESALAQAQQGTCLVVSNNPYILRQLKVLRFLLPNTFILYGTGPAASPDESAEVMHDEFARSVYMDLKLYTQAQHAVAVESKECV